MALTLLQIVNTAQAELGLIQSSSIVGNSDLTTVQMYSLTNRCLDEIRRMKDDGWSAMQVEYNLVVNPPVVTTGNILAASPSIISGIVAGTGLLAAQFWMVSGNSIPSAARVLSVDSGSQVHMTMQSTNTSDLIGTPLTFAQDTYPMPSDFEWFQNRTMWDRTNRWELLGPDSPQMDQWHRSGIVVTGPRRHFRQLGKLTNTFRIWPQPSEIVSPLQLVFEYNSNAAVVTHGVIADGFTTTFQNDDDQPVLDDLALVRGLKWMWREAKGFNYGDAKNDWIDYVETLMAKDGASPTLSMVKRVHPIFVSPANVQDGFFPGPVGPNTG